MNRSSSISPSQLTQHDWDEVHAQIQSALDQLATRVRQQLPTVRSRGGRTAARGWFLFSYCGFSEGSDDSAAEDEVAGIQFTPEQDKIRIRADIGGGETGVTDFELPERLVPASRTAVLEAAQEFAEDLSRQDQIILKALAEHRSPPDYRKRKP